LVVKCRQQTGQTGGKVGVAAACKNITCIGGCFTGEGVAHGRRGGVWKGCLVWVGFWSEWRRRQHKVILSFHE